MGKELCFHKIGPIMVPKRIGYKIFTIFLFACVRDKMTKTGTADLMKCASKIHFRTRRVRYTLHRQGLDHSRPKGNLFNSVYNVDQAMFIGAWDRCKCKLSCEKKMPHGKKTMKKSIRPMTDSKKKSPSPLTLYHFSPYYETKYFILR